MATTIVEVSVGAPYDAVWAALREPREIRRWHGWEYEEGTGLAGEIEQIYGASAAVSQPDGTITIAGLDHRFEVERGEGDRATVVRVTKPGDAPADEDAWDEIDQGWITFVEQLRFYAERRRGEDRRTFMLALTGGPPLTLDAAGLVDLRGAEPFFTTRHQIGLVVPALDDGLAVLHAPPAGGGRVIAGTYGLDEAELTAVRDRWAAALGERYDVDAS